MGFLGIDGVPFPGMGIVGIVYVRVLGAGYSNISS
jgi:hypothetical protein